jgi:TniQ
MPAPRPLGRSLLPIPGESLPGFLLRLSCRLQLAPARLVEVTGLALAGHSGTRSPAILLAGIPAPASQAFTRMTRLTADKVTQLGLVTWKGRYPLPAGAPKDVTAALPPLDSRSVFAPATRYCPDCLTGEGSAIQESFGGPWRKTWHLPVVFACPLHQRLLEHRCPECDQIVRGRRPGTYAALLPAMRVGGLHPAQCRTELTPSRGRTLPACCGARLDQAARRRPASPELIALQGKILDLLDPDGPVSTFSTGRPAQPISYFTDLQALGLLACSTWPAARHLSPSEETASAIDQHVTSLRRQAADRQDNSPPSASRARSAPPPMDAAASGGLVHIADRVLAGSPDEVRERLRLLLPASTRQASRTCWGLRVARSATPCSEGLQAAYAPLLRGFTKAGGLPQGRRDAVLRPQRWGPENIPAFLPEDWYDRHFTPLAGISPMFTRRTAVLRLVQMVAGGSLGEAAGFLGIASTDTTWLGKSRIYSGAGYVHTGAREQPDPLGFETALNALALELNDPATPLINYRQRRQALETWCIDEDTWTGLVARLPPVPGPQQPELGDRKRQIASIYVWVQLTSGEHHFAPRPIEAAQPPEIQEAWSKRRNTIWHLMQRSQPRPHYTSLKTELNTLATSLARAIDAHRSQGTHPSSRQQ